jgi:glycerol-3-phosphate dehydrogenase (NAD(P)+)
VADNDWGGALARRLATGGAAVTLVGDRPSRKKRPKGVEYTDALPSALAGAERVVVADDVDAIEARLRTMAPHLQGNHRLLTCARGLTPTTHLRASEAVLELTAVRQVAVLAGAVTPRSISKGQAGALVVGSAFPSWSAEIQGVLASDALRVYTNLDRVGVELANAISAVLGVALGAARGLKVGASIEATALTRGAAEMDRLVTGFGGKAGTAFGLAGLGVLAEAAFSGSGDAIEAGVALAKGEDLADFGALKDLAQRLAARAGTRKLRAPMVQAVAALMTGKLPVDMMFQMLMTRASRAE